MRRRLSLRHLLGLLLPVVGLAVGLTQLSNVSNLLLKAQYKPAAFIVDTQGKVGILPRAWNNLAQGGESPDFSLKPMMTELANERPGYIRIDHLYDFYITVQRTPTGLTYDFSKLDQLIAEMTQTGATPFISLSYTPSVLHTDITGKPANYAEYTAVITQTIEHISGKRGLNIKDVYYEVWNEPDLFGQWKLYGEKNYLELYAAAAKGAAAATEVQPFKLGGPATTKLYDNWITDFIDYVAANRLRLDFYSWHHYNRDPEAYILDVARLNQKLRNYPAVALKLEYVISEWGLDSDLNPAYDSTVGAAHLAVSSMLFPPNLSKAFLFEIQDGKSPENVEYWGRWGLYTHPDFGSRAKPRLRALQMLNQLGPDKLSVVGQGSHTKAMAAKKGSTIQLLMANYDTEQRNAEQVPVTFKRLRPGVYTLRKQYLGRSKSTEQKQVETDTVTLQIPMMPNSVVLLELIPQ